MLADLCQGSINKFSVETLIDWLDKEVRVALSFFCHGHVLYCKGKATEAYSNMRYDIIGHVVEQGGKLW
jgi:hypothetical protein